MVGYGHKRSGCCAWHVKIEDKRTIAKAGALVHPYTDVSQVKMKAEYSQKFVVRSPEWRIENRTILSSTPA